MGSGKTKDQKRPTSNQKLKSLDPQKKQTSSILNHSQKLLTQSQDQKNILTEENQENEQLQEIPADKLQIEQAGLVTDFF